ncbi:S8 family serine peptidase [Vibrio vulnificus]|uniref:S8 family peptidase n=1 Tax=Vibrio vulnificus TaxID=672 RepID=UPI004059BF0F
MKIKPSILAIASWASLVGTFCYAEPNSIYYANPQLAEKPKASISSLKSVSIVPDEYYSAQYENIWRSQDVNFSGANGIAGIYDSIKPISNVRIGIVDSQFVETPDLTFSEGYSFIAGHDSPNYLVPSEHQVTSCGYGHGTAVASLIGAKSDDYGIRGIVKGAELIAANIARCDVNSGAMVQDDAARAIRWLAGDATITGSKISAPVDVINLSIALNDSCHGELKDAIDFALGEGITVVAGAANDNKDAEFYAPGNCVGVITVGGNTIDGFKSWFSNYGALIEITARADRVVSASSVDENDDGQFDIREWQGTSFATPLVTGVVALLKQENPGLTPSEISMLLGVSAGKFTPHLEFSDKDSELYPKSSCDNGVCGYGILNAAKAVAVAREYAKSTAFKLEHGLERECDIGFYINAVGDKATVCELYELNVAKGNNTDIKNSFIEVYSYSNGAPNVQHATLVSESTGLSTLLKTQIQSGLNYGYRLCETVLEYQNHYEPVRVKKCVTETLIPISSDQIRVPIGCE